MTELQLLVTVLLDPSADLDERADAAAILANNPSAAGLSALIQVAEDGETPASLAGATGQAIAKWLLRHGDVNTAWLAEFSGEAYLGFDEEVARHQRPKG